MESLAFYVIFSTKDPSWSVKSGIVVRCAMECAVNTPLNDICLAGHTAE